MFKILHARPQNNVNQELPDVQAGFRKGRGTRHQIVNIRWIIEKTREFQKNISLCFIDYTKAFDCVDHNKLWEALLSPCHIFSILSHSVVLHSILIFASWPSYRFLRRRIMWSGTPISLRAFHRKISSSLAQKSLQRVTASIKSEYNYFLAGKLWQSTHQIFSIPLFFWQEGSCQNASPSKPMILYLFCEPVLVCEMLVISSQEETYRHWKWA